MTSPDLPQTIVLHLGAHKTASTHLQQSVAAAGPYEDVAFVGPPILRGRGKSIPARFGFPLDPTVEPVSALSVRDVLRGLAQGKPRLVLSDENFAGKLQTGWGRIPSPLYFTAAKRVGELAGRIVTAGGPPLQLCLAVRDPAGYLNSAFSQILHGKRVILPEKFREKNPLSKINWADYVATIAQLPHVAGLTVWRQEDYAPLFHDICKTLLGGERIPAMQERTQPRLSQRAVEGIMLAKSLAAGNVVAEAAATFPVAPDNPPYQLYDPATLAASVADYTAQCDQIAAMAGVTLLRPSNA